MSRGWAVVLGASSGFGAAAAQAFARAGHPVLGLHFDTRAGAARAEAVAQAVRDAGVDALFVNGNAADPAVRTRALDALAARDPNPTVDVLLHSLAFGTLKPFTGDGPRIAPRDLAMTLDVMAHSLLWWTNDLLDRGWLRAGGRVLALTSSGSLVAFPAYGAVSAAKAALESHVRQLAVELAPRQITVNAVMAGLCRTPALARIPGAEKLADEAQRRNPSGRLTTPDDVAHALVALTAPGLAWMTGNVLRVDGGETISAAPRDGA